MVEKILCDVKYNTNRGFFSLSYLGPVVLFAIIYLAVIFRYLFIEKDVPVSAGALFEKYASFYAGLRLEIHVKNQ